MQNRKTVYAIQKNENEEEKKSSPLDQVISDEAVGVFDSPCGSRIPAGLLMV